MLGLNLKLISLAVVLAFSAGCGKSKKSKTLGVGDTVSAAPPSSGQPAPSMPQTAQGVSETPQTVPPAAASGTNTTQTNEDDDSLGDAPDTTGANTAPVVPTPAVPPVTPAVPPVNSDNSSTGGGSSQNGQPVIRHHNHNPNQPGQNQSAAPVVFPAGYIPFTEDEAVKTGGRVGDLFYTSAAGDGIMKNLKKSMVEVVDAQDEKNLEFSKTIVSAKIVRSAKNKVAGAEVVISEMGADNKLVSVIYKSKTDGDLNKINLVPVADANQSVKFTGGFAKCLDVDGSCNSVYVKVKTAEASAQIILRTGFADRFFLFQKDGKSVGLKKVQNYVYNTIGKVPTNKKIASMKVSSFEVVYGRSSMGVLITLFDRESVAMNVPLFVEEKGTQVHGTPVAMTKDLSQYYDLPVGPHTRFNVQGFVKSAELVNNNGLGQVKIKFDLSDNKSGLSQVWLIVSRAKEKLISNAELLKYISEQK